MTAGQDSAETFAGRCSQDRDAVCVKYIDTQTDHGLDTVVKTVDGIYCGQGQDTGYIQYMADILAEIKTL